MQKEKNHSIDLEKKIIVPVSIDSIPLNLKQAAERAGWTKLMPVQQKAIPYMLAKRDVMVQSHTGSGKTGAFVLPLLDIIDINNKNCQALILVPTRELAMQVTHETKLLAGNAGVNSIAVYGGTGYSKQIEAFKAGAHIVVGTPGRILDHLIKKVLLLDKIEVLIMDEADRMLSMGFYQDMKRIQQFLPDKPFNSYMFSATFPPRVMAIAKQFLKQPEILSLSNEHIHVPEIEHEFYNVPAVTKDRALIKIIELENPDSAIIFCNRKSEVSYLNTVLQRYGYDTDELSSDLSQIKREKVLNKIRNGNLKFLIATDVAARGIDLPYLSHVIQYAPPEDLEIYIHRSGRTGRAGASGKAITLLAGTDKLKLNEIASHYSINFIEKSLPDEQEIQKIVAERTIALLEAKLRECDRMQNERLQRFVPLAKQLAENTDELACVAMLLDEYYRNALHTPVKINGEQKKYSKKSKKRKKTFNNSKRKH